MSSLGLPFDILVFLSLDINIVFHAHSYSKKKKLKIKIYGILSENEEKKKKRNKCNEESFAGKLNFKRSISLPERTFPLNFHRISVERVINVRKITKLKSNFRLDLQVLKFCWNRNLYLWFTQKVLCGEANED